MVNKQPDVIMEFFTRIIAIKDGRIVRDGDSKLTRDELVDLHGAELNETGKGTQRGILNGLQHGQRLAAGAAGAGGIGYEPYYSFQTLQYQCATTAILIRLALVFLSERLSSFLRKDMFPTQHSKPNG